MKRKIINISFVLFVLLLRLNFLVALPIKKTQLTHNRKIAPPIMDYQKKMQKGNTNQTILRDEKKEIEIKKNTILIGD